MITHGDTLVRLPLLGSWVQAECSSMCCAGPEVAEKLKYLSPATLLVVPNTLVPVSCPCVQAHAQKIGTKRSCLRRASMSLA